MIRYASEGGIGRLVLDESPDPADADALQAELTAIIDRSRVGGVRKLELEFRADDRLVRRAALRSGFRVDGVRRAAVQAASGELVDVTIYSHLQTDVDGPARFSAVMNTALPRKRLIAHVLMRDASGRILLCDTRFKADWELPGGIVEPNEAPGVGAVREVAEELGIELTLGRLLVADWMPPYLGWEDALELIFDGGLIEERELAGLTLQPSEIDRVALVTLAQAAELVTPLSHRRLTVATLLAPGETAYLENGVRPG